MKSISRSTVCVVLLFPALLADEASADADLAFFEAKIRPVLVDSCYECHSAAAEKAKGGLRLDTGAGLRRGGDSGPAIIPHDPEGSLLLAAISHLDPDLEMPPKQAQLPATVIHNFRRWIEAGAPDPREGGATLTEAPPTTLEAGRAFWAFRPPQAIAPPEPGHPDWPRRPLDHFILAALEDGGLEPSPDAAPPTLLRRLHFDLVGLPPRPERVTAFSDRVESDGLDEALAAEVDHLLRSERYGERWGRHWLDVARYAESNGKESNVTYPHAWRYRDYVIDSFNADKPYDRFLTEQIAGDLLPWESEAERAEHLIATGFLALGAKVLNEQNPFQFAADVIDEQIDTVSRAVMASSVACARCHDHKFDPFSMRDYYALAGIFLSTETFYGTWVSSEVVNGGDLIRLPQLPSQVIPNPSLTPQKVARLQAKLDALNREEKEGRAAVRLAVEEGRDAGGIFTLRDVLRIIWQRGGIEGQLEKVDETGKALPLAMGVSDRDAVRDAPLLHRGEIAQPGPAIPRGFPRVIELAGSAPPPADSSGRLQLARWLTHPGHPLTARVLVNRVWHHLLGTGLVPSTDHFGYTGERPSHPELLDHLALLLVENGWSIQSLIREIVLSRTYRQASDWRADPFQQDPENRYLWRASKRRMEAECIRDAMLTVSENLDLTRRQGSLVADVGDKSVALFGFTKSIPADLDGSRHRSVYLPVVRDRLPDILDLFDFAEPSLVTGDRDSTNVPPQALYLLNSPFVQEQATGLADRLRARAPEDTGRQVRLAFAHCFSREPDAAEEAMAGEFLARSASPAGPAALDQFCQALLGAAEFRNLD